MGWTNSRTDSDSPADGSKRHVVALGRHVVVFRRFNGVCGDTIFVIPLLRSDYPKLPKYSQEYVSSKYGIVSFTEKPLCRLMWAHYAARHTGFVAEFSVPKHFERPEEKLSCCCCIGCPACKVKYLVTGVNNGVEYAPPYFSGSTAAFFGESPANGSDSSQYVAVWDGGSATLSFSTPQNYLGLLWGSVGWGDCLSFYDSANNVIGTVLGSDVLASNSSLEIFWDQNGTGYVNITSTTAFSSVVATQTATPSFEFDDVAYAQVVPEPASLSLLIFGMFGINLLRRHQR